ncbi:DUF1697 domain-containing protein [Oscillibacter sp.]|uniref:DUF1697 domain-containing protein n=1 Tax=Oscillibacter sp. TaxID=1945593 RepID=UPI002898D413|nr:DUF1697 domain-containing protein [Oscillibacter sp.]
MKRQIAFLRGINVSGKNKIPMAELKDGFEELGFQEVKTYLNSGNVIFSSDGDDVRSFTNQIETMIKNQFGLDIPVFVILKEELEDILRNAPDWWGNENKEIYDNLIFIMPPATFAEVFNQIGEPKEELEKIRDYKEVVFWSFSRKDYQKTNWWSKTASARISKKLTIRTANTVKKIVGM